MTLKLDKLCPLVLMAILLFPAIAMAQDTVHTVKRGDTLYALSRRYGVSVQEIQRLNNMQESKLFIGQKLIIVKNREESPVQQAAPEAQIEPSADALYTIQRGDNLYRIARAHALSLPELLELNGFENSSVQIFPGQQIRVKHSDASAASSPAQAVKPNLPAISSAPPDTVVIEKVYIVQPKDTLFKISRENGISVEELKRINGLSSNEIMAGQRLYLAGTPRAQDQHKLRPGITEEELLKLDKIRDDLVSPVAGKVLSEYGLRNGRPHKGIDLGAKTGTPIYAVLDGTVVFSGAQGAYGNVVVIEHPDFVMTVYAHNEKNLVSVGETVDKGQQIATVGATGNATGSHLHFEYRIKGKAINPRKVLPLD